MENRTLYALYCATVVSLGGFVFGFDASVISGVVGFVSVEFDLTPIQSGFVVAAPTLSGVFGTMVIGPLSDALGRKKVLLVIAFLYLLSALASAFASSYMMLVTARAIGGLAFTSLMIAPMYIAEIAPARLRGKLVSINQLNIVIGLSAAYFANYYILGASESHASWVTDWGVDANTWRWMLGVEIVPAVIFFLGLFLIPDSPRWLISKGREEEAREVMGKLLPSDAIDTQIQLIRDGHDVESESLWHRVKGIFGPRMRLALVVGIIVGIVQQITGINAIFFYAPTIFEQSGIGTDAAFAQAALIGLINVVFTLAAIALIDRWGRKPLLLVGLSGIAISMAVCTYGFSQATYELTSEGLLEIQQIENVEEHFDTSDLDNMLGVVYQSDVEFKTALSNSIGTSAAREFESQFIKSSTTMNAVLILLGIVGFVASFAMSLGPVMWALFAEIFPNQLRGVAISFVGMINSLVSFCVQLFFPVELSVFGAALTFFSYCVFAIIGLVLVAWLLPETKGKTLEELEVLFAKRR
ncbi:sugar porter family MFS transporter [Gammaproteobacteria bacterium]|nr:sugar porter family MFS transporter [Gammaproteobacteria bacterium]